MASKSTKCTYVVTTTFTHWFWMCSLTAIFLPMVCTSRRVKEDPVTVKYSFDVTRVDDILIPQQPMKNEDLLSKDGEEVVGTSNSHLVEYSAGEEDEQNFQSVAPDEMSNDLTNDDSDLNNIVRCPQGVFDVTNSTDPMCQERNGTLRYSSLYKTVACTLSAIIFIFGLLGNILVIIVISRTRSMHTTTNCYLLSLSVADSLVLLAATLPAIPETFFRVDEWPYGRVMCSMLIFLQYLGVDSSSLSITAFTIERYIAICHPMRAQTMCTLSRAKKIIAGLWGFTILYCSPWLGLTEIKVINIPGQDSIFRCQHRLARSSYLLLYMIDLILFYVIPLIIAIILYLLIGRILFLSRSMSKNIQFTGRGLPRKVSHRRTDSRVQVVRMLVVVVVVFATLWMPYRVMVVYNSFAQNKYMDLWFLLFARTMVYTNCAINPILYNIMSVKFKRAFRNYLSCWHRRDSLPATSYNEMNTDVWATRRNTNNTLRMQQPQQQQQQQQQQRQQQHPDTGKYYSRCLLIKGDDQSSHHNNSQKKKLLEGGSNLVHVHQQKQCAKNSGGTTNNNSTDCKISQLLENAV